MCEKLPKMGPVRCDHGVTLGWVQVPEIPVPESRVTMEEVDSSRRLFLRPRARVLREARGAPSPSSTGQDITHPLRAPNSHSAHFNPLASRSSIVYRCFHSDCSAATRPFEGERRTCAPRALP